MLRKYSFRRLLVAASLTALPASPQASSFADLLRDKRLVMGGCLYCGIEFDGVTTLFTYAESTRDIRLDEFEVRWISTDLFIATQKGRNAEGCPPQILVYRVENVSRNQITLREYWTGWPRSEDIVERYRIVRSTPD